MSGMDASYVGIELSKTIGKADYERQIEQVYIINGRFVPASHVSVRMGGAREYLESILKDG